MKLKMLSELISTLCRMKREDEKTLLSSSGDEESNYGNSKKRSKKKLYLKLEITPIRIVLLTLLILLLLIYLFWDAKTIDDFTIKPINASRSFLPGNLFESSKPKPRLFVHQNATKHLQCARFFQNDTDYIKQFSSKRIVFEDPLELPMSCEAINERNFFPSKPASKEEANFPIARAKIVYKDYLFLEMELAAAYAPQNYYCFAIDAKASPLFHTRVRQLAKCLPNIIITQHEYKVDSAGHNMGASFFECLKMLAMLDKPWKYVHLLQNHDTSLRTNLETVRILRWMNGSNDVEVTTLPGGRVDEKLDWSFQALKLFKNESRNNITFNSYAPLLIFSKGYVESTLSRAFIDFVLHELDITELMQRIEKKGFGIDEILIPTLDAADALAAPGGFTHHCLNQNIRVTHITRKSVWYGGSACASKHLRHAICIFGVEDLQQNVEPSPHLFINKIMPEFDFAAVACWYERLFNRTHIDPPSTALLNPHYYLNLGHVRFQYLKDKNGIVDPEKLKTFDCKGRKI